MSSLFQRFYRRLGLAVDALLVYTTTTMLYEGHALLVPYFFDQYGPWASCGMKV